MLEREDLTGIRGCQLPKRLYLLQEKPASVSGCVWVITTCSEAQQYCCARATLLVHARRGGMSGRPCCWCPGRVHIHCCAAALAGAHALPMRDDLHVPYIPCNECEQPPGCALRSLSLRGHRQGCAATRCVQLPPLGSASFTASCKLSLAHRMSVPASQGQSLRTM